MNHVEIFRKKFEEKISAFTRSQGASLEDAGVNSPESKMINQMLKWAFGFSSPTIKKMVWGKKFTHTYKNQKSTYYLGGIDGFYAGSAVWRTYESILFFLETGWWPMGLDKCTIKTNCELKTFFQVQDDGDTVTCFYSTGENFIVAATKNEYTGEPYWYYTTILIRPEYIEMFLKSFKLQMVFEGVNLDFENGNFISSSYSSVDPYRVAWEIQMK
jgi:hypothetical protein